MHYIILDLEWNQPQSYQSHVYREVGDKLKFRIWRDGETMDITVRIMDSTDLTG